MSRSSCLAAAILALAACDQSGAPELTPPDAGPAASDAGAGRCDVTQWPAQIDFGEVRPGLDYVDQLFVDEACVIEDIAWSNGSGEGFRADLEGRRLSVRFQSLVPVPPSAVLEVRLADGVVAEIEYLASNLPLELELTPELLRVPATGSCASDAWLSLANPSSETIRLPRPPAIQGPFELEIPPEGLPERIEPSSTARYRITTPLQPGAQTWSGSLTVEVERNGWRLPLSAALEGHDASDLQTNTETFTQDGLTKLDVLFVLDDSPSMGALNDFYVASLDRLLRDLSEVRADVRVALTTTSSIGILNTIGERDHLRSTEPDFRSNLRALLNVGTTGVPTGQGLESAARVLESQLASPLSRRFLREDAAFYPILVSNQDDRSPRRVEQYVELFRRAMGGDRDRLFAYAIVGNGDCRGPAGTAMGGQRATEWANQLGGEQRSICSGGWGGGMLASDTTWIPRVRFTLGGTPVEGSLELRTGGQLIPEDRWSYEPAGSTLWLSHDNFDPNLQPHLGPGDSVEARYERVCP